jgi:hypothetical protein
MFLFAIFTLRDTFENCNYFRKEHLAEALETKIRRLQIITEDFRCIEISHGS